VQHIFIIIASCFMSVLVTYRHNGNIQKIKTGTENKISWL
jgi:glycerol-3-phosphate acyltransferase PlsY